MRWVAQGTYCGGFPGASQDAAGSVITFHDTDFVRVENGLLVEYWLNADPLSTA
ncbi:hypothetical protein SRB5_00180 [Streptomyces sp. RB5]|uniref:SnoaL-like polyketide cyclase n=1 Tax=Streptomyces smaragdinus TaxID=2585196 RepID=A0A7K0C8X6_9ACTN|nr:hypothetical protein [Streptomyces smaragdinus]MQY09915.1 hypothetical protein [Streptomyces smaragdinus]